MNFISRMCKFSLTLKSGGATDNIGWLFGDLTNCTIDNMTVNVNPTITFESSKLEKEFD